MYSYIFSGKIHPERVNFSVGAELSFGLKHEDFGFEGTNFIKFENSAITIRLESNIDCSNNQACNLETLKNIVEENIRMVVDIHCFINSYSYDVEITHVICEALNIDYSYGVRGEWNIIIDGVTSSNNFTKIISLFDRPERIFLKDVLGDFRRAIKYPAMTASFCFRAIETIRKFYFEDVDDLDEDEKRKNGWTKLNQEFGLIEKDFNEIKKFAIPNRHGEFPSITYLQRESIMNFTRKIINKLFDVIVR